MGQGRARIRADDVMMAGELEGCDRQMETQAEIAGETVKVKKYVLPAELHEEPLLWHHDFSPAKPIKDL